MNRLSQFIKAFSEGWKAVNKERFILRDAEKMFIEELVWREESLKIYREILSLASYPKGHKYYFQKDNQERGVLDSFLCKLQSIVTFLKKDVADIKEEWLWYERERKDFKNPVRRANYCLLRLFSYCKTRIPGDPESELYDFHKETYRRLRQEIDEILVNES